MLEKKQQFANQAALLVVCCCHAVIESQVEGYFCSIIYLSEDKRGREGGRVHRHAYVYACEREIAQDLAVVPMRGCLLRMTFGVT